MANSIENIPVLPLRDVVIFPSVVSPLSRSLPHVAEIAADIIIIVYQQLFQQNMELLLVSSPRSGIFEEQLCNPKICWAPRRAGKWLGVCASR